MVVEWCTKLLTDLEVRKGLKGNSSPKLSLHERNTHYVVITLTGTKNSTRSSHPRHFWLNITI